MLSELLYIRKYRVLNAPDGEAALEILEKHPEIKLVITDYHMPGMDGCKLVMKIRERFKSDRLAIIGLSSADDRTLAAKFIKNGANDCIVKQTFIVEEFYLRVNKSIQTINLINQIKENAITDYLTGLYNRRHFFEAGNELLGKCQQEGVGMSCAMLDIDFFKAVNDNYGHDVGDEVLKDFAEILKDMVGENEIVATCSMGCCTAMEGSLDEMTKLADEKLYQAKEGGRNQVAM